MAENIERGGAEEHKAKCSSCGSLVDYVEAEMQSVRRVSHSGEPEWWTWIDCPSCPERIVLEMMWIEPYDPPANLRKDKPFKGRGDT